jgi:hypothetical protein
MNLVFIHGRAQGGKSPEALHRQWLPGLKSGLAAAGYSLRELDKITIKFPFYGDRLDELVRRLQSRAGHMLERATGVYDVELDPFVEAFVRQMAQRANIDAAEALMDLETLDRGAERWQWVQALVRLIEQRAPWVAELAIGKFATDVKTYLSNAFVQAQINDIVLPALQGGPCVVVAHSLGSVVAYVILASHPEIEARLLVTAGSPLGMEHIKSHLPIPLRIPAASWLNLTDEADFVALYAKLSAETFIDGIENLTDIDNGDDPHSIVGYLSDPRVAKRLATALF